MEVDALNAALFVQSEQATVPRCDRAGTQLLKPQIGFHQWKSEIL